MIDYCNEIKGKTRIFISKHIWNLYDALRKDEYLRRIGEALQETKELREYLLSPY